MPYSASKLQSHLACKRITFLDYLEKQGEIEAPDIQNSSAALLQELGEQHEANYIADLSSQGKSVIEFSKEQQIDDVVKAMKMINFTMTLTLQTFMMALMVMVMHSFITINK